MEKEYILLLKKVEGTYEYMAFAPDIPGCEISKRSFTDCIQTGQEMIREYLNKYFEENGKLPKARSEKELKTDGYVFDDFYPYPYNTIFAPKKSDGGKVVNQVSAMAAGLLFITAGFGLSFWVPPIGMACIAGGILAMVPAWRKRNGL